ncbi:5-formyltetrahydrofolate cyclo-ligase [Palleronia marisminoris]|uniref:5-formyltetrahydrofolate cyclo-ligase n=1 Tax=Palleronia marisminoris TaxID=315423 RepID=A0A1Y5RMC6_9RHOB|nr:5-formyltetrahydrofolate cyclo-ligase [Palleronia marisminoris]SFG23269.1 5-formyltetrahydrofolate cyclo-ligase [Palleronia marisminoris]SLN18297.1 putative 5-formyltetrahydrofolate cyclo-ligase [Palleronia marisminoris]
MTGIDKDGARKAAFARRKAARGAAGPIVTGPLLDVLDGHRGRPLSGYAPIGTEIDPGPALRAMAEDGPVCLPVVDGPDRPLRFRTWTAGREMIDGPFGAPVPASGEWIVPEVLIVPLLAFDRRGGRLGYGGGFYDRTLEVLRRAGPITAIGFAYALQEDAGLPLEPTDALLDLIVTEREVITPTG